MQTVIIAGGLGTRLKPVAGDRPKALVEVAGRPFIDHQLELLLGHDLRDVLICAGYGGDQIEEHLGEGWGFGMDIEYSFEDPDALLGTGGALVNALPMLEESFAVLYGDSYLPTHYATVMAAFKARGLPALMCVFRNEGRWDASNVRVEEGKVSLYSKTASPDEVDCIDYGLTIYRREVIERYREVAMPLDLATVLGDLAAAGELGAFVVEDRFYEIGKPEGLAELDKLLRGKSAGPEA